MELLITDFTFFVIKKNTGGGVDFSDPFRRNAGTVGKICNRARNRNINDHIPEVENYIFNMFPGFDHA